MYRKEIALADYRDWEIILKATKEYGKKRRKKSDDDTK